jgi:hypothetical protein
MLSAQNIAQPNPACEAILGPHQVYFLDRRRFAEQEEKKLKEPQVLLELLDEQLSLYGAGQLTQGLFGHKISAEHMLSRLEVPEIVVKVYRFLLWRYLKLNDPGGPMKLLTGFLSFAAAMLAQGDSGRITGRVLDSTGAVVVTAQVTATEQDTGVAYKAVSSATGAYAVAFARFLDGWPASDSPRRPARPALAAVARYRPSQPPEIRVTRLYQAPLVLFTALGGDHLVMEPLQRFSS